MSVRFVASLTVILLAAFSAGTAAQESSSASAPESELCKEAKGQLESEALQGLLEQATLESGTASTELEEANAALAEASAALMRAAAIHFVALLGNVDTAQAKLNALNAESQALTRQMSALGSGSKYQELFRQRTAKQAEIAAAQAGVASEQSVAGGFGGVLKKAQAASGAFQQAVVLTTGLGTAGVAALGTEIAAWKLASAAASAAEDNAALAADTVDCVGGKLATIQELEGAAEAHLPTLVSNLLNEMSAKRQEIQQRKTAVQEAWVASGEIDGGPQVPPLIEVYLVTIREYLEMGALLEEHVGKLQASGEAIDPRASEMLGHYAGAREEMAAFEAQRN